MTKANMELPNGTKITIEGTSEEVAKSIQLIQGKKEKVVVNKEKSKKAKNKGIYSPKLLTNLDLRPKENIALKDFYSGFELNSFSEKILCVVYYLKEKLAIEEISPDHIFTGLKTLGQKIPTAFKQAINDTKIKKGWIEYDTFDNITISIAGSNYIEHDVKKIENA